MKIVIVSGFFNPLHGGHMDMIDAAKELGDKLIVIVNNDEQQLVKKEKIILDAANRLRVLRSLRAVDEVLLAIDEDMTVSKSLAHIARQHPGDTLVFANGGDRSAPEVVPERETCQAHGIEMVYGVGGAQKADSSTRINQALGHKK